MVQALVGKSMVFLHTCHAKVALSLPGIVHIWEVKMNNSHWLWCQQPGLLAHANWGQRTWHT